MKKQQTFNSCNKMSGCPLPAYIYFLIYNFQIARSEKSIFIVILSKLKWCFPRASLNIIIYTYEHASVIEIRRESLFMFVQAATARDELFSCGNIDQFSILIRSVCVLQLGSCSACRQVQFMLPSREACQFLKMCCMTCWKTASNLHQPICYRNNS